MVAAFAIAVAFVVGIALRDRLTAAVVGLLAGSVTALLIYSNCDHLATACFAERLLHVPCDAHTELCKLQDFVMSSALFAGVALIGSFVADGVRSKQSSRVNERAS